MKTKKIYRMLCDFAAQNGIPSMKVDDFLSASEKLTYSVKIKFDDYAEQPYSDVVKVYKRLAEGKSHTKTSLGKGVYTPQQGDVLIFAFDDGKGLNECNRTAQSRELAIVIHSESVEKEFGGDTGKAMQYLKAYYEDLQNWASGECYWFRVYERNQYGRRTLVDSCGGFYSREACEQAAGEALLFFQNN